MARFDGASAAFGFSTKVDADGGVVEHLAADDAVAFDAVGRDFLQPDDAAAESGVGFGELSRRGRVAEEDGVAEHAQERPVADDLGRLQDGVAEAELFVLEGVMEAEVADELVERLQRRRPAAGSKAGFQRCHRLKMVANGWFFRRCDDDGIAHARAAGLVDDILDDRRIQQRQ
jgi:hypothetical protein